MLEVCAQESGSYYCTKVLLLWTGGGSVAHLMVLGKLH